MSEHKEQCSLFQLLTLNAGKDKRLKWIYAVPNAAKRTYGVAARMKAEGLKAGVSDICIPIPSKGYHGAYIEMKWAKNKPTPEQSEFLEFVGEQGYATTVAYSSAFAQDFIEKYLGIELSVVYRRT